MAISASLPIPADIEEMIEEARNINGIAGIPGGLVGNHADLPLIALIWVGLLLAIAERTNIRLDEEGATKIATAVASGVTSFAFGTKAATTVASWLLAIPSAGLSLLLGAGINAGLNWKLTDAFGKAVARYFLQIGAIADDEVAAQILWALVATQFGIPHNNPNVVD